MASTIASLFQGTTPPATTTYGQNTSSTPSWLQNYAGATVADAASLAGQPYQQFPGPQVAPWTADQTQAQQNVEGLQGSYQPLLNQAQSLTNSSANPAAFSAAQGMIPGAASTIQNALTPTQAQMNPYIGNVINQAENQATQYWNQTLQPSINQQYAAAGQAGSSADITAQNQGANLVTQNIQNTAQSALAGAYSNAQTAGLQGGQALGSLAQTQGGLGYEQGILGLQGAGQLGSIAQTGQSLGLQDAGTLYNVGAAQQAQGQTNLNTAYNNFENQTYYPENQLSWLQGIMTGTPSLTGTAAQTTQAGYLPGAQYGATPINQATGIYSGLNAMSGTGSAPTVSSGTGGYSSGVI